MGLFARLLGRGVDKGVLAKQLFRLRYAHDPMLMARGYTEAAVDRMPFIMVMGLPEGTLITLVEMWVALSKRGLSNAQIAHTIDSRRGGPLPFPPPDGGWEIMTYVYGRLLVEHGSDCTIPQEWVLGGIAQCLEIYA